MGTNFFGLLHFFISFSFATPNCNELQQIGVNAVNQSRGMQSIVVDADGTIVEEINGQQRVVFFGPGRISDAVSSFEGSLLRHYNDVEKGGQLPETNAERQTYGYLARRFEAWSRRHGHQPPTPEAVAELARELNTSVEQAEGIILYFGARDKYVENHFGPGSRFGNQVIARLRREQESREKMPIRFYYEQNVLTRSVQDMRADPRLTALRGGNQPTELAIRAEMLALGVSIVGAWQRPLGNRERQLLANHLLENGVNFDPVLIDPQASMLSLAIYLHRQNLTRQRIAELLGVSESSLANIFHYAHIEPNNRKWTDDEEALMRAHYPKDDSNPMPVQRLADNLGRTVGSVYNKARDMGLTRRPPAPDLVLDGETVKTEGQIRLIGARNYMAKNMGKTDFEFGKALDMTPHDVAVLRRLLGLYRPEEVPTHAPGPKELISRAKQALPKPANKGEEAVDAAIIRYLTTGELVNTDNAAAAWNDYFNDGSTGSLYTRFTNHSETFPSTQAFWRAFHDRAAKVRTDLEKNAHRFSPEMAARIATLGEITIFDVVYRGSDKDIFAAHRPTAQTAMVNRAVRAAEFSGTEVTPTNMTQILGINEQQVTGNSFYGPTTTYYHRRIYDSSAAWKAAYRAGIEARIDVLSRAGINGTRLANLRNVLAKL